MNAETGKRPDLGASTSGIDHASMGPRSHERGNALRLVALVNPFWLGGASMGPRSHERGNAGWEGAAWNCFLPETLQWGRVLMNAETRNVPGSGGPLDGLPGRISLQWGRVLMNAETERNGPRLADIWCRTRFNGAAFS